MSSASARLVSSQGHAVWFLQSHSHLLTEYQIKDIRYTDFLVGSCKLLLHTCALLGDIYHL